MSKAKRQAKQEERNAKLLDGVLSGKVTIELYEPKKKSSQANRKGGAAPTEEEEKEMTGRYARILRKLLPGIMVKLSQLEDPRDPGKVRYSLPMLMLFGILMFLSHCPSRRSANRNIAHNNLLRLVEEFVPGVKEMPHADTLARLLKDIDVEGIDRNYEGMIEGFISTGRFKEIQKGPFRVAFDGTQKFSRRYEWDARALSRNAGDEEKERYYVYVLESVLILDNGMILPLLTEILENGCAVQDAPAKAGDKPAPAGNQGNKDNKKAEVGELAHKQDCETKAFYRLTERLVKLLGKGCVSLVMDGIYATGPVISRCNEYAWDYMIVLKSESLKTVWEDFNGLRKIEPENTKQIQYGERRQEYHWSNGLEYIYGRNNKRLSLNLVTCTETWIEEHERSGKKPKKMKTEYAWLSSKRVTTDNVFELCTIIARSRWRIENLFHIVKHQGYNYTHCYSYNWNAMKGFHYLMKFGLFINVIIAYSVDLSTYVQAEGLRGFIQTIWKKLTEGKWPPCEIIECKQKGVSAASVNWKKIKYPPLIKAA